MNSIGSTFSVPNYKAATRRKFLRLANYEEKLFGENLINAKEEGTTEK